MNLSGMLSLASLGIAQGLTEFLPVSSSGHLALLGNFFGVGAGLLSVSVALHAATLAAVAVFFRRQILEAVKIPRAWLIAVAASAPTALIGLALSSAVKKIFAGQVSWVYIFMAVTGAVIFAASRLEASRVRARLVADEKDGGSAPDDMWRKITFPQAIAVGVAQGVAVLPGISRSGATISAGMAAGLSGKDAAAFSFIVSMPAVAGAALLEMKNAAHSPHGSISCAGLFVAMALAFASGLFAIRFLIKTIESRRLGWFSFYLWAVSAAGIAATILK